jgi:hypothetical protein
MKGELECHKKSTTSELPDPISHKKIPSGGRHDMTESKAEFYKKVLESLTSGGYPYFDSDKESRGKGKHHASKPDYIAIKDKYLVIGEIKSPAEPPTSGSWRQVQKNDFAETGPGLW